MKPTDLQKKTIDTLLSIIKTWKSTNDITSPTHICDVREFLNADLMDDIDEKTMSDLEENLIDLWWFVRRIEENCK